jgi:ubiquinone/menaquinone biosynthesis C-methylase UbiE
MTNLDTSREQRLSHLKAELESIIVSKGWGRKEENGTLQLEREEPAMTGQAAQEFYEQSLSRIEKYQYIVDTIKGFIERYKLSQPVVADIGTGPGLLPEKIAEAVPEAKVIGVDISADMIQIAQSRIDKTALKDRVKYQISDAREYYKHLEAPADIVVSRNMLHRLSSLQEDLLALTKASKDDGGITFVISFRNAFDLNESGIDRFIQEVKAREQYPDLQKAYALAFLNAPTLKQYEDAGYEVAQRIKAGQYEVSPDLDRNYVNILIRKQKSDSVEQE